MQTPLVDTGGIPQKKYLIDKPSSADPYIPNINLLDKFNFPTAKKTYRIGAGLQKLVR